MRYQQQELTSGQPDGLPAPLTIFDPVLHRHREGIVEDLSGFFEADAMFAEVALRLAAIPFEVAFLAPINP